MTSFPEIGRVYKRVRREAAERGKEATTYQYWRAIEAFRRRVHSIAKKDPKERDPATQRASELETYLEGARHGKNG